MLRVDGCSEGSYIDCDFLFMFFFSGRVLTFVYAQIWFFAVWFLISSVQFIYFLKREINSTIEQQKRGGHENCDRVVVSKVDLKVQISQRNKFFLKWSRIHKLS